MKNILKSFIATTIVFAFYAEYKIGNLWFRKQSDGKKHIQLKSLINLMINPLKSSVLWRREMLDINYVVFLGTGIIASHVIQQSM